jgi:hypothetical protein
MRRRDETTRDGIRTVPLQFLANPIPTRRTSALGIFDDQTDPYQSSKGQTDVDLTDFGKSEAESRPGRF